MKVGRSSPRYQELALLYSRSTDLQANIHEYFIVVVQFCHEMINFTRKSAFAQFASSLNSETLKKTRSDLVRWAGEIESGASFLLAKSIKDEATENLRFRQVSNKFSKSISEQQMLARRLRILDECSDYDHQTTWKQIRKSGNTLRFSTDAAYQDWKAATESSTLLYFGKLGCGKSVALANIVDDLTICEGGQHTPVVYFFIRQDLPESLKARTVIGSLARQLLGLQETFTHVLHVEGQVVDSFLAVQNIVALLRQTYTNKTKIFIILDGLDLCDHSDKVEIIDFVRQLQLERWLLVCVSLRQESAHNVETVYQDFVKYRRSSLPDNTADIEEYVEAELARCLRNHTLVLGDARLILKIQDTLLLGSSGMFLWVVLQIRTLCMMARDDDLIVALEDLPVDLTETYRRILDKARGRQKVYQSTVLGFILAAQQPLIRDEMREALSVTAGDTDWTTTSTINDMETILRTCGCLIQIDEEEHTVRFVHPSVQAYLLRWPDTLRLRNEWQRDGRSLMEMCHITLAEVIVTYLSYGVLDSQVSTARIQHVSAGAIPARVVESVTTRSSSTQRLALKFLAQRKRPDFDLSQALAQEVPDPVPPKQKDFVFQHYARKWCLSHVSVCHGKDLGRHIAQLLPDLLRRPTTILEFTPETALRLAVENDNERFLRLLLAHSFHTSVNYRFETRHRDQKITYSLMDFAVCKGNSKIIRMIWPHADEPVLAADRTPSDAICDLIYRGTHRRPDEESWNLLPEHYSHICQSGRNILACAIWARNTSTIKALIHDHRFWMCMDAKSHILIVEEALQAQDANTLIMLKNTGIINLTNAQKAELTEYAKWGTFLDAFPIIQSW